MDAVESAKSRRLGRVLAAERERQGLGAADIAQRLHMSVWQVEALESDEYTRLPRGPFLRGFVRNYAKILGLAPESVLAMLAEGAPRDPAPRIVVPSQNIRFDPLSDRIASPYVKAAVIAAVAIAFGFAAMYWWLFIRNTPQGTTAARKPAAPEATAFSRPLAATRPEAAGPKTAAAPEAVPAPVKIEPAKIEPAKIEPVKNEPVKSEPARSEPAKIAPPRIEAAKPPVASVPVEAPKKPEPRPVASEDSGGKLKFRFKGQSWVEIRDARGKVLLTGLNDPGSEAEVIGKPPFRVVVGNAQQVKMFVNDREFDLEPHMREAVARVTVQ